MENIHAAAPWGQQATPTIDYSYIRTITDDDGNAIADVRYSASQEKDLANACLIEQAPALLAALQAVKTELSHLYHNGQVKANAPERERIEIMLVNAEYVIEKATDSE